MTQHKPVEDILRLVAEATAPLTGEQFFRTLVHRLATALNVRYAFITECLDYPPTRVRMLAYWAGEQFAEPREFALADTPCEIVYKKGRICYYPKAVSELFPQDKYLINLKSYIGVPIFEPSGTQMVGHIAIFDDKEMANELLTECILRIFAARASAEIQRLQGERALRASREKYRLLVENQTDLVIRLDREGRLTFASPSYCEMFNKTEEQLLGTVWLGLFGHQADINEAWQALVNRPHRYQLNRRTLTAHGWRWIAWAAKAVFDENQRVREIVAGGRDITEQKRAEEQARQHLNELAHVSRLSSMGEMASALAHELNQPLTSIISYAQVCRRLLQSDKRSEQGLQETLERIGKNAKRMNRIIRRLRSFIRKGEPQRTCVAINYLVREVIDLVTAEATQSGVTIATKLDPRLESIYVDSIQIEQVILNLLRNAIDAINASANDLRQLTIATRPGSGTDAVEISVSDSGIGIPAELGDRVFEPFTTTKPEGMGIGLSISRSIVEAHGGRLWATPNAQRGTTFHIWLPTASESDAVGSEPPAVDKGGSSPPDPGNDVR